jgi:hypothetical protein
MTHSTGSDRPRQEPPTGATSTSAAAARPEQLPAGTATMSAAPAAPSLPLPGGAAAQTGVTAWVSSMTFNALFSINQSRNSWVGVAGVGWKKLSDASDSASIALSMLSAHAREKQSPVNYREEADAKIHEVYVW